jgi:hypothetical protein
MIVATTRTPIDLADLPGIVCAGYVAVFDGTAPSDACRRIAIAQLVLEHGRRDGNPAGPLWGVYCWNLGNQDAIAADLAPSPDDSPTTLFRTVPECEGTACQRHAQHIRRAFASAPEGAAGYWRRLSNGFPEAAAAAQAGDVAAFVAGLRQRRYFTGAPAAYLGTMSALVREGTAKGW